MTEYVRTADLPAPVQAALTAVGYHKQDIRVTPAKTAVLGGSAGNGSRSFAVLVSLTTGQHHAVIGSWGGPNMFTRDNPVDNDTSPHALPDDGVVITGVSGGGNPTMANIFIPASMTDRILPAPKPELTDQMRDALYCHQSIKGGQYRREELARRKVTPDTVHQAVENGWLKRNKAGATSVTTEGKNALGGYRGH